MSKCKKLLLLLCLLIMVVGCGKSTDSDVKDVNNNSKDNVIMSEIADDDSESEDGDVVSADADLADDDNISKDADSSTKHKKNKAKNDKKAESKTEDKSTATTTEDSAKASDKKSTKDKSKKADDKAKKTKDKAAKDEKQYVSFTIECNEILDNIDRLSAAKRGLVPDNGIICQEEKVEIKEGDTVWDVLTKEIKAKNIQMEYNYVPLYKTNYIEGIAGLYEFDMGDTSGWRYMVNGKYPGCGCDKYKLKDKDKIVWHYTVSLT